MPFIYSTLTCGNTFVVYAPKNDPNALSRIVKRIEINGGHGIKNQKSLETPQGVVTKVTDEDLALLQNLSSFKRQVAAGYLIVDNKKVEPEKKAAEMAKSDKSAPMTRKDFEKTEDDDAPVYKKKR